jgi:hypothetical protein|tara:strand:- start:30740 stop:31516 length:777 start_codon:yes stop_codon:yes gene_type:complete
MKAIKNKRKIRLKIFAVAVWSIVFLFLAYDIIITHVLAFSLCHTASYPEPLIGEPVDYPESIYWEDNIYPGFNESDRAWMIRNYLDGVHLKAMALNGPDGTIHWYTAGEEDWRLSRKIKAERAGGNYFQMQKDEAFAIAERGVKYTKQTMPEVNYTVTFNEVPLSNFERKYLWSDEIRIFDNTNAQTIGFNRRLMRRWYRIFPDLVWGNRLYHPEPMCGDSNLEQFEWNIFNTIPAKYYPPKHQISTSTVLYQREVVQ